MFYSLQPRGLTRQGPLSLELSRQEYWSGLPFPSPRDLSDPGITPESPALQADSLPSEPPVTTKSENVLVPHFRRSVGLIWGGL